MHRARRRRTHRPAPCATPARPPLSPRPPAHKGGSVPARRWWHSPGLRDRPRHGSFHRHGSFQRAGPSKRALRPSPRLPADRWAAIHRHGSPRALPAPRARRPRLIKLCFGCAARPGEGKGRRRKKKINFFLLIFKESPSPRVYFVIQSSGDLNPSHPERWK